MLDIKKILTISIEHVSDHTIGMLEEEPLSNAMGISVYFKSEYGFFIYCPDNDNDNIPDDLKKCFLLAKKHRCKWLCLDCDADIVEDL